MPQFIRGCTDCGEWPISEDHRCPATYGPIPNWVQQLAAKDNELDTLRAKLQTANAENERLIRSKKEVHQKLTRVQQELSQLKKEKRGVKNG